MERLLMKLDDAINLQRKIKSSFMSVISGSVKSLKKSTKQLDYMSEVWVMHLAWKDSLDFFCSCPHYSNVVFLCWRETILYLMCFDMIFNMKKQLTNLPWRRFSFYWQNQECELYKGGGGGFAFGLNPDAVLTVCRHD